MTHRSSLFGRFLAASSIVISLAVCVPGSAQWINFKDPSTPRTKDGKPNMNGPVPKASDGHPDLSGIWERVSAPAIPQGTGFDNGLKYYMPKGAQVPLQPWAQALYKERFDALGGGRPSEKCLPHGIPDAMLVPAPFKIIQNRGLSLLLYEEYNHFRQIFTDGRSFPADMNPAWFGYSIGKWDRDVFAVDSRGFNSETWLDDGGLPHTEELHTIESYRRTDFGHMELVVTIDDPKAYTKPWSATIPLMLLPDTELMEDICANEKDSAHIQSKSKSK